MAGRRIGAQEHRSMPWKNGGGATAEIAIAPPGASVAGGFDWRLSIASIAADGPFSAFPGYDRVILLLEGAGMILSPAGQAPHRLDRPFQPFRFSGEAAVDCRLLDGPCRDLNLMVARDRFAANTAIWRAGEPWPTGERPETDGPETDGPAILFVCQGSLRLNMAGAGGTALARHDTLVLEAGERPLLGEASADAVLFRTTLRRSGQA